MGNFKDFDLDLRNVASGGEAEPNGLSKITTKIMCSCCTNCGEFTAG